jgi:hypothetical protein
MPPPLAPILVPPPVPLSADPGPALEAEEHPTHPARAMTSAEQVNREVFIRVIGVILGARCTLVIAATVCLNPWFGSAARRLGPPRVRACLPD